MPLTTFFLGGASYDKIHNVPDTLLKNLAQMLGWGTPSSIAQVDLMDALFNRGGKQEFKGVSTNKTPTELKRSNCNKYDLGRYLI